MDIQTAKQIRIADYLHSLGYSPIKQQGVNLWYKSPLREEAEASFKVNTEREQWYDFGLGKGGGIIELAAHLYATDHVPYILKRIAEQTPHVRPVSFSFGKQSSSEPSFQQLEIVPLSSPALLAYLQGRGINIELAKRECSEARFTHNGKRYFAIAFPNGSGGYEVQRRGRDSNPRYSCPYTAFRVRPDRPLRHLSFSVAGGGLAPFSRPKTVVLGLQI